MPRRSLPLVALALLMLAPRAARSQIGVVQPLAEGVFFHEGDPRRGTCNNGWIVLRDYVVVVDANYPVGAQILWPKIGVTTAKPVRFVVDTHFHPDHASGNRIWSDHGATIVAQDQVLEVLTRTGAARWALEAKARPDVAASSLYLPDVVYSTSMAFDDGSHRVELHFRGPAHTNGDTLVWLPHERILFTGDVCVNGAYNYIHDCDLEGWIKVLEWARALQPLRVCPGHGPIAGPEVLEEQQGYLRALRESVAAEVAEGGDLQHALAGAPALAARLRKDVRFGRFVPTNFYFQAHVETAFAQLANTKPTRP
jgi:cyclase